MDLTTASEALAQGIKLGFGDFSGGFRAAWPILLFGALLWVLARAAGFRLSSVLVALAMLIAVASLTTIGVVAIEGTSQVAVVSGRGITIFGMLTIVSLLLGEAGYRVAEWCED